MIKMNNIKGFVRRNCAALNRFAVPSMYKQQLLAIRATIPEPCFSQRHLQTVQKRHGLTKMEDKYMYVARPNVEANLTRKKCINGLRHPLNEEFKSDKAKIRWSEFRRRMIYGNFAA